MTKLTGRPPINESGATKKSVTTRIPNDLHALLVASCFANGKSLNREIFDRLYRTFRDDEVLAAIAALRTEQGEPHTFGWLCGQDGTPLPITEA